MWIKQQHQKFLTLVAIPTGAGQKAAFQGEINPWMNSTPGSFLAVAV